MNPVFQVIKDVCNKLGYRCNRADSRWTSKEFMSKIWRLICKSRLIIADLTGLNSNVLYELGLADGIRNDALLITQDDHSLLPSDLKSLDVIQYRSSTEGLISLTHVLEVKLLSNCLITRVADKIEKQNRLALLLQETQNPQWNCYWDLFCGDQKIAELSLWQNNIDRETVHLYVKILLEDPRETENLRRLVRETIERAGSGYAPSIRYNRAEKRVDCKWAITAGLDEILTRVILETGHTMLESLGCLSRP